MEMDSPIYVLCFYREKEKREAEQQRLSRSRHAIKTQLVVIHEDKEKEGVQGTTHTTSDLPDFGRLFFPRSCFSVFGNSRLVLIGGSAYDESKVSLAFNEIRYIDLQQIPTKWETKSLGTPKQDFCLLNGTAVSKNGKFIYAFGRNGNLYALDSQTMELQFKVDSVVDRGYNPNLLAFSSDTNKIYLNCCSIIGSTTPRENVFGYCDIPSRTWHAFDTSPNTRYFSNECVVVVKDLYLIHFGNYHPLTGDFNPALYVYDIEQGIWIPQPVEGLENDGHALPYPVPYRSDVYVPPEPLPPCYGHCHPVCRTYLVQVGSEDELKLKLALVWSTQNLKKLDEFFHCSKFTLTFDADATPPFKAKHLSSVHFAAPDGLLSANFTVKIDVKIDGDC